MRQHSAHGAEQRRGVAEALQTGAARRLPRKLRCKQPVPSPGHPPQLQRTHAPDTDTHPRSLESSDCINPLVATLRARPSQPWREVSHRQCRCCTRGSVPARSPRSRQPTALTLCLSVSLAVCLCLAGCPFLRVCAQPSTEDALSLVDVDGTGPTPTDPSQQSRRPGDCRLPGTVVSLKSEIRWQLGLPVEPGTGTRRLALRACWRLAVMTDLTADRCRSS